MDLRSLSEDAPESQWREPMRDKVGAEQLQQVHHCTTQTGGSDCGPEGQRSAPSGSRRAATGVRNNRRVCSETVEDHDRRFWHRWPLTWRSSHAFTVLNTTQFHVRRLGTDLARRKPGVQIPSPPPHKSPGHRPKRVPSAGPEALIYRAPVIAALPGDLGPGCPASARALNLRRSIHASCGRIMSWPSLRLGRSVPSEPEDGPLLRAKVRSRPTPTYA